MRPGKTLLPYFGGKAGEIGRMTAHLLELIPHSTYCELFGGMAGVLTYKDPVLQEVYNDINSDIVNLFRVLRNKAKRKQLREALRYTPYSREEWTRCCATYQDMTLDDVERARCMFVVLGQGTLGRLYRKSWGFGGPLYGTSPAKSFYKKLERLDLVAERFRNVSLECQPAEKLIPRWNNPKVLQYLDITYHPSTRTGAGDYIKEMSHEEHVHVLELVLKSSSKIVLAGYPNELYAEMLEANGWPRQDFTTIAESAKKSTGNSSRTESLWFSPNCGIKPAPKAKLTRMLHERQGEIFT